MINPVQSVYYVHPGFTCVLSGCQAIEGCSSRPESEYRILRRNLGVLFRSSSPQGLYYGKYGNKDQSPLCRAIIRKGNHHFQPWDVAMPGFWWVGRGVETTSAPPKKIKKGTWDISSIVSGLSDFGTGARTTCSSCNLTRDGGVWLSVSLGVILMRKGYKKYFDHFAIR